MPKVEVVVCVLARDRFSPLSGTMRVLLASSATPRGVILADPGYTARVIESTKKLCQNAGVEFHQVPVGRYATTNHAWNECAQLLASDDDILVIENDSRLEVDCLEALLDVLRGGSFDVLTPVILESDLAVHFDPGRSLITNNSLHGTIVELDRGRESAPASPSAPRRIDIVERHCLAMTAAGFRRIGTLDEQMFCRTDLDFSMQCRMVGLRSGIVPRARVRLAGSQIEAEDLDFFDVRWDVHRIRQSHDRLIRKWRLNTYKRTIDHAYQARERLALARQG